MNNRHTPYRHRRYYINCIVDRTDGEDVESLTASKKYQEGVKKVGPGCKFYYRCIFDPVPNSDLKDPAKYGVESVSDDQQS